MPYALLKLPLAGMAALETRAVLKRAAEAHRYLAELKGVAASIPNEAILINTLSLQEAKDSSEIENIVTTHDALYKANLFTEAVTDPAAKEVQDYAIALTQSFQTVRRHRLIMLDGVIDTAQSTIRLIGQIKHLMQEYKQRMRQQLPKLYRQELLNNLFNHPYTRIEFVMDDLGVSRITATKYLEQLTAAGFLHKEKIGRTNYFINQPLCTLLIEQA